jgi:DNA-binding CsgD family transcriptional regulator
MVNRPRHAGAGVASNGTPDKRRDHMLLGRARECEELDELLDAVRRGDSQALVLRGEPGIGKTALLDYAVASAHGFKVVRATGLQAETELAFAALHQLCAPILDLLERLPEPQQDALAIGFGLRTARNPGDAPDPFLIGLGVLSLLSEASAEQPLLCVIDNEQFLDQASADALAFAARRLFAEPVAMVFATTQPSPELAGLPERQVTGLRDDDARALLAGALAAPLDEHVLDRIVAETRGNPLALLELPKAMSPAELAGGFGLPATPALSTRIEDGFRRRFESLPPDAQLLSLVAAAESTGDPATVWRAAERLGVAHEASAPAAAAGLVEFGTQVRFRHPLARSAAYHAAPADQRQRVHRALAEVIEPDADPARRVWHRALGTTAPNDEVADELERSAHLAQARGGIAASAAFLAKSVEFTMDSARRGERALAAAQAKQEAGDPDAATAMVRVAERASLDELQQARADLLRARIAFAVNRGRDAPALLLRAAARFGPLDTTLARQTLLDAFAAALFAGRLAGDNGLQRVAEAARRTQPCSSPPTTLDLLLDGLALLIIEGTTAATPLLQQALSRLRSEDARALPRLRWLWLASRVAMELYDDESWDVLSDRQIELARQAGALGLQPIALRGRVGFLVAAGRLNAATMVHDEQEAMSQVTRSEPLRYGAVVLAAWRGQVDDFAALVQASTKSIEQRGEGGGLTLVDWSTAVLYNAVGRYPEAVVAAERASNPYELGMGVLILPELVEAAARSGEPDRAAAALQRLSDSAKASGTDWARGLEARSRALISADAVADSLYRKAIDHLSRTRALVDLARAHLVYGEWLRRQKRRLDAREHLQAAHEMFTAQGLDAFAERTARELHASGGRAAAPGHHPTAELTSQEAQVARLARDGLSNAEIGNRLFISPRTAEYHLSKVYAKLGITSRSALPQIV